jgi:hypothetical protein
VLAPPPSVGPPAASARKVKYVGKFSIDSFGCFNYSQDQTDRNIVIPAIEVKLKELGANVADNIVANAPWYAFIDIFLFPFVCMHYTVSGEALLVEMSAVKAFENFAGVNLKGRFILFQNR